MYDEMLVEPMRRELTQLGIEEARTVAEVDRVLGTKKGTALLVVNSVCGCAAGMARPAVAMALETARERNAVPDKMITVFAGNDRDATARAREYLTGYRPSSPSIALFRDGEVVKMLERWQIEGRAAYDIAAELASALEQYCARTAA
ncbi:MAG TPA: BrxA/BrxB family bacilliredoxin [Thermoanaerobaculia bacterium]|nr:BrxA/BrxB family bacilliredoxin [Thermoanaerobaculia bacterium]